MNRKTDKNPPLTEKIHHIGRYFQKGVEGICMEHIELLNLIGSYPTNVEMKINRSNQ